MKKKLLALLLALMLVIGIMPLSAVPAFAAASVKTEQALFGAVQAAAAGNGEDIKLTGDIAISQCLRIPAGSPVILDLNGYTIDRGLTECQDIGSVIRVEPGAVLTIRDSSNDNSGVITGGASWNGGGICNHGTLTIEGGTIRNNKSLHSTHGGGGGIYNGSYQSSKATLTLAGGVIINNEARNGAGVYNGDGTLIIKQGSYQVKELSQLKTYYTNVKISDNSASEKGSGIYNSGELKMQDAPNISGNKNNDDIFLAGGKVITLTGKLGNKQQIGIKSESENKPITSGYFTYHGEDPGVYFKSADPKAIIRMNETKAKKGEVILKTGSKTLLEVYKTSNRSVKNASELYLRGEFDSPENAYVTIASAMMSDASQYRVEITLGSDWSHDFQIGVPSNSYMVVDLNGHYIKRNRNNSTKDDGSVFRVFSGGALVINDSNPSSDGFDGIKGGVITGGASENGGGGITVDKDASLYMNGGTIHKCTTDYHGGGICAKDGAKLIILKKCTISSCSSKDSWDDCNGGGIYAKNVSRLELENVTVKNCYSEDYGGGLYYYGGNNGIFIISACTFSGNKCEDDGGAVFYSSSEGGYFDKSTFTSNHAGDDGGAIYAEKNGNNVYSGKKDEPVMIRESTLKSNSCGDEGSAVFVNRNDLVFVTDTITGNNAGDKGAIYVSHNAGRYGYDISIKGLTVIKDNKSGTASRSNIVLENFGATHNYIYCAGLYEGSYVSFSVLEGGKVKVLRNVDSYQLRYFHPEKGSLSFEKEKTTEATLVTASVFSKGSYIGLLIAAGAAAAAAAAAVIYRNKKKGDARYDDSEE